MNRRDFLRQTASLTAACSILPGFAYAKKSSGKLLKSIGIQLFSLPKMLEHDFRKAIEMLAGMGYREIELYGPYPFSAESAKAGWEAVTPQLGFSGSGFFGHSILDIKTILNDFEIRVTSIHTDLETLQTRMPQLQEAAEILGFKYACIPYIPENLRSTLDEYKRTAELFNIIGEEAINSGIRFGYHNHGYGLQEKNGQIPFQIILDETDSGNVFFELDIFWTVAGGANPADYLQSYPERFKLMHIKDMKELVRFAGDGGSPAEWISLFPYMTTAGNGVLDLQGIIEAGLDAGVEHFFVEQDMVENPETALKMSIDHLKAL
ncbi:MAG: sugar phosphate isomerase/epimerase [Balneolaceae bacterium]|nr:MAG: sugar phosphate isomerase/epimerase [Balneolaceae bacterium]